MILDLRNDIYNPTKGSYHNLQVELASPLLLSDDNISFVMVQWRNSFYVPLFANIGLQVYGGAGYAHSLFAGRAIATARLTNDLALGGRSSIRGYSVNRFSPLPTGYAGPPIEDTAFWNGRAEIGVPIVSNFSAAVFFDSGQVFPNLRPNTRHDGVGLGIRYKTPVGPMAVDLAQGLGPDKEIVKFYFTVGTL
jgi:translocation and assembly module TamA